MFATYLSKWQVLPYRQTLPVKQSFWDTPGITQLRQVVKESKLDAFQRAQFLAASAPHSGNWLLALPIASSGLRLDDEAIRVAVALRLGLDLGAPHTCRCGALVDARGQHGLVYKQAPSRIARHQQLNDLVTLMKTLAARLVKCLVTAEKGRLFSSGCRSQSNVLM